VFARSFAEKGIWRFALLVWLSCSMFAERRLSYNTQRNVFFSEKLRANTAQLRVRLIVLFLPERDSGHNPPTCPPIATSSPPRLLLGVALVEGANMPVSKHRRRSRIRTKKPDPSPDVPPQDGKTLEELRQAIANPARDFRAKAIVAGVWWFQQLLRKVGDRWQSMKNSREDKRNAALLLCVAMDGEHGQNDDLSPLIAEMLNPSPREPVG
jgi:hypothetical protein